jgi:hypothetical protein
MNNVTTKPRPWLNQPVSRLCLGPGRPEALESQNRGQGKAVLYSRNFAGCNRTVRRTRPFFGRSVNTFLSRMSAQTKVSRNQRDVRIPSHDQQNLVGERAGRASYASAASKHKPYPRPTGGGAKFDHSVLRLFLLSGFFPGHRHHRNCPELVPPNPLFFELVWHGIWIPVLAREPASVLLGPAA